MNDISSLNLKGKNLSELPLELVNKHKDIITNINLSNNKITNGKYLNLFTQLDTLSDHNNINNLDQFPSIISLKVLWLNNNKINNLSSCILTIKEIYPNLTYLSMMFNPAVPNIYTSPDEIDNHNRYRRYIIKQLPKLEFLDAMLLLIIMFFS